MTDELQALLAALQAGGENAAPTLSALCALAKKKDARERIDAALSDRAPLTAALRSAEPKARKNAARLLGALERPADANALLAALESEKTLFVVPSVLLALGSVGSAAMRAPASHAAAQQGGGAAVGTAADVRAALLAFAPPTPKDESEVTHCREIHAAREKALSALTPDEPFPPFCRLPAPRSVLVIPPAGFSAQLFEELTGLGFAALDAGRPDGGLRVATDDLAALLHARCAFEVLLPVAQGVAIDPAAVAEAFHAAPALPYRIELRGYAGDRAAFVAALASRLGGRNNPSHYAVELRVDCDGKHAALYEKRFDVPDGRYAYRRGTVPASMHPATAAALIRFAAPYRRIAEPDVLDPFCGSGTLLFEREQAGKCASLLGCDLAASAVQTAKENARAGHSRAFFVQKDALAFVPRGPVGELYANLPFGNRVGSHKGNEALYEAFIRRLPDLLDPKGMAVLYTMEYRLLARCLKASRDLTILSTQRTEAGGLLPYVFVAGRR